MANVKNAKTKSKRTSVLESNYDFRYKASHTAKLFHLSTAFIRGILGPIGCVRGDTKIITEIGIIPISELTEPVRVLSWNESKGQFQLSLSGGSFPKGKDYLYRVLTTQGEFVASGHHLVFCGNCKYQRVDTLVQGQSVYQCSHNLLETIFEDGLKSCALDVQNYKKIHEDYLGGYAELARQYGQQLLEAQDTDQVHIFEESFEYNEDICSLSQCLYSYNNNSISKGTILSIEKLPVKEVYWDMQVLDTNNYVSIDGSIHHNSGKSVACCIEMFLRAQSMTPCKDGIRRSRWAVVRNTQPQLETTTIKTWLDWFPEHIFGRMTRKPPFRHEIKVNDIEMEVIFLALDKPEDVKKLLSLEVTGIWFNEAREIGKSLIDAGSGRVGRYPSKKDKPDDVPSNKFPSWSGIIMDTNPPDDTHWWYNCAEEDGWAVNEFGEKVSPDSFPDNLKWEFFKQPSGLSDKAENIENLVEGYYQRLIAGKDKEWINVYVHGNYGFIQDGKPVYGSAWNDDAHVSDKDIEVDKNSTVYIGLDFGLTPCAIFGQRTARGRWNIIRELVTDDMDIESFAMVLNREIQQEFPNMNVIITGDPAGAYRDAQGCTVFEILKRHGLMARPAQTNNVPLRIQAVMNPLNRMIDGKAGLLLDKKCKILRRGFNGGYKYKKIQVSGGDKFSLEPDKNNFSHPHDALQYLLLGGGEFATMRGRNKTMKARKMDTSWSVF